MKCLKCGSTTYVTETRAIEGTLRRRRSCSSCLYKFFTLEAPELAWRQMKVEYAHEAKADSQRAKESRLKVIQKAAQLRRHKEETGRVNKADRLDALPEVDEYAEDMEGIRGEFKRGGGDDWN